MWTHCITKTVWLHLTSIEQTDNQPAWSGVCECCWVCSSSRTQRTFDASWLNAVSDVNSLKFFNAVRTLWHQHTSIHLLAATQTSPENFVRSKLIKNNDRQIHHCPISNITSAPKCSKYSYWGGWGPPLRRLLATWDLRRDEIRWWWHYKVTDWLTDWARVCHGTASVELPLSLSLHW